MVMRVGCCHPAFQGELQKLSGIGGPASFWPLRAELHPFPQLLSCGKRPCRLTREVYGQLRVQEKLVSRALWNNSQ